MNGANDLKRGKAVTRRHTHRCWMAIPLAGLLSMPNAGGAEGMLIILQRDIAFVPRTVTVKVGQQILFRNEDPFGHNVFSPGMGGDFDIGLQAPGTETPVAFSTPGEFIVQCRIHPKMRAKVTVVP